MAENIWRQLVVEDGEGHLDQEPDDLGVRGDEDVEHGLEEVDLEEELQGALPREEPPHDA